MKIRKYKDAGKLIEAASKAAPIGRIAASLTPAGDILDTLDLARAISTGNILDAILSGTSLLLPGSYNQAIKSAKALQRNPKIISRAAEIDLAELATRRPKFAQAIVDKSEDALKLERAYERAASGKTISPSEIVLSLDEAGDNVLIPLLESRSALTNPRVLLDYAARFEKTNPTGKKLVGRILTGKRGMTGTMGGIVKEGITPKHGGVFTSDDFATAFYYSGLGKRKYSDQIYKFIKENIHDKKAQEFALERLKTIDTILQKHAKTKAKYPFLSTGKAAAGRVPNPKAPKDHLDLKMLPESLQDPRTIEDLTDRITLETATEELGMFLGDMNMNGIVPIYAKIPRQGIYAGNAQGQLWNKAKLQLTPYLEGNADKIAKSMGKDDISIIENVFDGSITPGNDIIYGSGLYYTTRMRSGGIIKRK